IELAIVVEIADADAFAAELRIEGELLERDVRLAALRLRRERERRDAENRDCRQTLPPKHDPPLGVREGCESSAIMVRRAPRGNQRAAAARGGEVWNRTRRPWATLSGDSN